MKTQIQTI